MTLLHPNFFKCLDKAVHLVSTGPMRDPCFEVVQLLVFFGDSSRESVGENYERNITPFAQTFLDFREAQYL
jgi:hypothetical protein